MLTILRGLPGSGKSTLALRVAKSPLNIASADSFFIAKFGEYKWSRELLSAAHNYCYDYAQFLISRDLDVVIDNTNIKMKDVQRYIDLAIWYKEDYQILTPDTSWAWDVDECFKRCTHNVPRETIQRMRDSYERHTLDGTGY